MDQYLARLRDAEQTVGLRGDLADPRADRQQQVGLLETRHQGRICSGAEVARKTWEAVVDYVLAAERTTHRKLVRPRKARDVAAGAVAPSAAADQHHRPLRGGKEPAQLGEVV